MKNKAFTVAEVCVVLSIIGFLSILCISSLKNNVQKNKAMFKKAYSIVEKNVSELVNDESIYPYDVNRIGFRNYDKVIIPGTDDYTFEITGTLSDDAKQQAQIKKFCQLLNNNLNTIALPDNDHPCQFQTTDSIIWNVESRVYSELGTVPSALNENIFRIRVDVNGNQTPNSFTEDKEVRDQFFIFVRKDGKIYVQADSLEAEFLQSQKLQQE